MAELDIAKSEAFSRDISNYSTSSQSLDYNEGKDVYIDFPEAKEYIGYYKKYGQLKKAIDTLSLYVVGKGYETDLGTQVILDDINGWGEDSIHSILWNMQVMSMVVGDSFAEIVRKEDYKKNNRIINIKPISAERMRIVIGENGLIKGYEQLTINGKPYKKFKPQEILHICNDRVGDEQRGTSVIESCKWVIDAIEEARRDYRVVLHRNVVPVRIIEIDTDNTTKRNALKAQYKEAINKGEVLLVPKGTVEIKDSTISIQDPITWIQSLENYFYLAVGIPRVIASPDALSEGASKVGYLIFEPIYTYRQLLLEADLWNQLQIKIKFNRPPSLSDNMQQNEAKNTSQTSFQPKDEAVTMSRE